MLRVEGPPGKHAVSYRCDRCGYARLQLADVEDYERYVVKVSEKYLRRHAVAGVDREDFRSALTLEGWTLWLKWQPDRGIPFGAYLGRLLPLRATEYYRSVLGRSGNKPTLVPVGDPDVVRRALGRDVAAGAGDPSLDSSADLMRLLAD